MGQQLTPGCAGPVIPSKARHTPIASLPTLLYKRLVATGISSRPAAGAIGLGLVFALPGAVLLLALTCAATPSREGARSPRFPSGFLGFTIGRSSLAEIRAALGPSKEFTWASSKEFAWASPDAAYEPLIRALCYRGADGAAVAFRSDFAERPGILVGIVVSKASSVWWGSECSPNDRISHSALDFAGLMLGTRAKTVETAYGPPPQYNDGAFVYRWIRPLPNARRSFSLRDPSSSTSVRLTELELSFGSGEARNPAASGGATEISFYQGPLAFPAIELWRSRPVNGPFPPRPAPDVSSYAVLGLVLEHSTMKQVLERFGPARPSRLALGDAGGVCYFSTKPGGTAIAFRIGENGDFEHPWNVQLISSGASVPWRSNCTKSLAVSTISQIRGLRLGTTEQQAEAVLGPPPTLSRRQSQGWEHVAVHCNGEKTCRELRYEWQGHRPMTWSELTGCVLAWGRSCLGTASVDLALTLDFSAQGLVSVYVSDDEEPD